jgi:hypothetical protein
MSTINSVIDAITSISTLDTTETEPGTRTESALTVKVIPCMNYNECANVLTALGHSPRYACCDQCVSDHPFSFGPNQSSTPCCICMDVKGVVLNKGFYRCAGEHTTSICAECFANMWAIDIGSAGDLAEYGYTPEHQDTPDTAEIRLREWLASNSPSYILCVTVAAMASAMVVTDRSMNPRLCPVCRASWGDDPIAPVSITPNQDIV